MNHFILVYKFQIQDNTIFQIQNIYFLNSLITYILT